MKNLLLFLLLIFPVALPAFAQTSAKVKTVCIDPGHGGKAPGKSIADVEELYIDGKFLYVVGKETEYNKISEQLAIIRQKIPDAFVIAVKNGKEKVDVGEAKKELGQ